MVKFGPSSIKNMENVHPVLLNAAHFALQNAGVDFSFFEGVRTVEKEEENIKSGASKLKDPKDCKHCVQPDGFGHAMDLVPFIDGKAEWDWPACFVIAKQIQQFCFQNNISIRWGGVWDVPLNKLSPNLEQEVEAYKVRHQGKDFLDGVHFEIPTQVNTPNDGTSQAMIA